MRSFTYNLYLFQLIIPYQTNKAINKIQESKNNETSKDDHQGIEVIQDEIGI